MPTPLNEYFHLTKGERRGILILSLFLLLVTIVLFVFNSLPSNSEDLSMERIQWIDSLDNNEVVRIDQNQDSLFAFDPNTIDIEEWKLLGFSQKQAESIEAYKEKGAFFKSKGDFKKVTFSDVTMQHCV